MRFEKAKKLIDLKERCRLDRNKEDPFYPPILDKNPIYAAQFLTIKDLKFCYEKMREAYIEFQKEYNPKNIDENGCLLELGKFYILKDSVFITYENFMWFSTFFKELEKILNIEEKFEIPYNLCPEKRENNRGQELLFQPPFHTWNDSKSKGVAYEKFRLNNNDIINRYRVVYIKACYSLEDFREGFPAWYLMHETTVFESYNAVTNVRVRIDFRNGEFTYLISGASDNWQIVHDVPLEIDDVVSAILFKT